MNRNMQGISRKYLREELNTAIRLIRTEFYDRTTLINFLSEYSASQKGPYKINYALFDNKGLLIAGSKDFMEDQKSIEMLRELVDGISHREVYETTARDNQGKKIILITRILQHKKDRDKFYIQFGIDPLTDRETLKTVLKTFLMVLPIIMIFICIGGFILTNRMVSHISNLNHEAKNLTLTGKKQKLPLSGTGDELDQLAETFNSVYNRLRDSYQRIVRFTSDASHELRLPIAAIKGEAEVTLENERGLEEYQRVLQGIIEEMDNLTRMLSRLLMLARSDSGEDKLLKEKIDMSNLVEKITEFYKPLANSKDISIQCNKEKNGIYILADKFKLNQLFSNLIENAIKYNIRNGKIDIKLTASERECKVEISDTGKGIPRDELKKIFDRFYRVDKSRSRSEGSAGLGLSIVQMFVKEHRGSINVESQPGKGSSFSVILPNL